MDKLATTSRPALSFSDGKEQNQILHSLKLSRRFSEALSAHGMLPLTATPIETMQINVGKVCNMRCTHCHVDAGPDRQESMSDEVVDQILDIFTTSAIANFDITGGAPELHPRFREIIQRVSLPGRKVIHRCNLTAIMSKSLEDIPALLAQHKVEIVASLPCYTMGNYDKQRGNGGFSTAIKALRRLNELGYGKKDSALVLNLVYNPSGAFLPGNEAELQAQYTQELNANFDVVFNNLFAFTNLPLGRFLDALLKEGQLEDYMTLLVNAFNPQAVAPLMCRNMISISWEGQLYNCDFNQMLELTVDKRVPQTVFDWDTEQLENRAIILGNHCYGCTAGAGSSCGGQTLDEVSCSDQQPLACCGG